MKIGYASINTSLYPKKFRSIRLKTVLTKGIESLKEIIIANLIFLDEVLKWNVENNIHFYRFPSNIFPLVTHPDLLSFSEWRWYEDFDVLQLIKQVKTYVDKNQIRLSTHPDQYNVLNSNNVKVVNSTISTLDDIALLLTMLGGSDLIIHVGGVYNDKEGALKRFIQNYDQLSTLAKTTLRIENDDKSYGVFEVLNLCETLEIPMVIDLHHHNCLSGEALTKEVINKIKMTWKETQPKCHLSSGKEFKNDRKHSDYISDEDLKYGLILLGGDFDIMVEAKAKQKAVLAIYKSIKHID